MKILCTGNPNKLTIANGIKQLFPETDFIYKSCGYDFTTDGIQKLLDKIQGYDIFINASRVDLGVQYNILKSLADWQGHIITIGSVLEYEKYRYVDPTVADDKRQLRDLSIDMCSKKLKTTYIVVGGIANDDNPDKMDPVQIAKTIRWILSQTEFHVPLIGVEDEILR